MSRHNINIQDGFLFQSLKEARIMAFDLVNGKRLEGRLKRFDRFAVVVDTGTQEILVYKHAISTITDAPKKAAP
ncbi:MAG: RNA chaperone Hfq [Acidobacteriota bacterium]